MLIRLVEWLEAILGHLPGAGLFDYISFRAGIALILSLIISMLFGGRIVKLLHRLQVGETVRDLGLTGQKQKQGTPTMGGVIIIMAILVPCLLMARLDNVYIILLIISTIWMSIIGFIDDYIKVFKKNKQGLKGIFKILGQVGLGLLIALTMVFNEDIVVRMDMEKAREVGISMEQQVGDVKIVELEDGKTIEKGDFKTNLTNVPFVKSNRLNYAWFLPIKKLKNTSGYYLSLWSSLLLPPSQMLPT